MNRMINQGVMKLLQPLHMVTHERTYQASFVSAAVKSVSCTNECTNEAEVVMLRPTITSWSLELWPATGIILLMLLNVPQQATRLCIH